MSNQKWIRVSRKFPCKICGRYRWCGISPDGKVAICMRVPSERPSRNGGYIHKLSEPNLIAPVISSGKKAIIKDFGSLAEKYEKNAPIENLAVQLGVSTKSLERLNVGWTGKAWSFPMKDSTGDCIGISLRWRKHKNCVKGSRNGIFWPSGVSATDSDLLMISEGASDCAALLDLGFNCIGRQSSRGGQDIIAAFLKESFREVVIVADNDANKKRPDGKIINPGLHGALKLAEKIKSLCKTLKIIRPLVHKDIRQWYCAGLNKKLLLHLIKNTREF